MPSIASARPSRAWPSCVQHMALRTALQQRAAEHGLQPPDAAADGRLVDVEPLRRPPRRCRRAPPPGRIAGRSRRDPKPGYPDFCVTRPAKPRISICKYSDLLRLSACCRQVPTSPRRKQAQAETAGRVAGGNVPEIGELRLCRRRCRHRRVPDGQPAIGRAAAQRLPAGGGRARQLDLVPHPRRLSLCHRQSTRRLDAHDAGRARPERPHPELSARQGDRRLLGDQRHDLHARPAPGLRPLARPWACRLGLGRCPRLLPPPPRPFPRCGRSPWCRRRMAGGGAAGTLEAARRLPGSRGAGGHSAYRATSTPARTRASPIST